MTQPTTQQSFGRRFRLNQLPGAGRKFLEVPAGYQGVARAAGGAVQVYPPGRHQVLTLGQRISGRGVGFECAILSTQPEALFLRTSRLLSQDDTLLDASLLVSVQMADPARLLDQPAGGDGLIPAPVPSEEDLQKALFPVFRRRLAEDLLSGLPTKVLADELFQPVAALLKAVGLKLTAIGVISLWRSEDRLKVLEKAQELESQFQMAELESAAQLEDFKRQLAQENTPVRAGAVEGSAGEFFSRLSKGQGSVQGQTLVRSALRSNLAAPTRGSFWWLGRTLLILFILAVSAYFSEVLFPAWLTDAKSVEILGLKISIWTFALGLIYKNLEALYHKREHQSENLRIERTPTHLDDLTGNDRARIDQLVRKQVANGLEEAARLLTDLRRQVNRDGNEDLALRLHRIERNAKRYAADTLDESKFQPAYLQRIDLDEAEFLGLLSREEDVLLYSNAVIQMAFGLRESYSTHQLSDPATAALDLEVERLFSAFAQRTQVLRKS